MTAPRTTAARRLVALAACLTLVTSACMFTDDDDGKNAGALGIGFDPVESGLPDDPEPDRGGQIVYGLEAETGVTAKDGTVSTGWCMPEAQLAISGLQVARAIYDPLVVPNAEGGYSPYLAQSVAPATPDDFTEWTITLRQGVTFHDDSALTADVVKNNLDAYRGEYVNEETGEKPRESLLFSFILKDIDSVVATNEDTVTVKMTKPWVAFDAALYSSGRLMIVSQKQLDASSADCADSPEGTGPFEFVSWDPNESLKTKKNPSYWQTAPDGKPYPYVEAVEFRPIPNSDARVTALQQGDINMMQTSTITDMATNLSQLRDAGEINLMVSEERTETSYLMFNTNKEELGELDVRTAIAQSVDREALNEVNNSGAATLATGPMAPEVLGYLDDAGIQDFDLDAAKKTVAALKEAGRKTSFTLITPSSPDLVRITGLLKDQLEAAGFEIELVVTTQSDLINRAIAGDYQICLFRNQPGDDPDSNSHWWGKDVLNFGGFEDAEIIANLEKGRTTADPEVRREAYEAVNRRMVSQVYNYYLWYSPWAVAEASNVHGILGPKLPHQDEEPAARLVTGHAMLGLWIEK